MALIALRLRPSTPATEVEKGAACTWNPSRSPARAIARIGSQHYLWANPPRQAVLIAPTLPTLMHFIANGTDSARNLEKSVA
jgi:hypothetical protein